MIQDAAILALAFAVGTVAAHFLAALVEPNRLAARTRAALKRFKASFPGSGAGGASLKP